ncbi:MAG: hypothetical protein LCH37_07955 [Bacteroidetes bacterium]|nr:hypothetical protein [Bacteroidota bacterium]MCK6611304.1 hypothetical protein [Bacteroidia bacterium]
MKKGIILSAILFGAIHGFTQNKSFIGLSSGLSLPLGNFASTSQNNPTAGLAKAGMQIDLSGSYLFSKHIGVCGLLRYQANPVNEDAIRDAMNPSGNPFSIDFTLKTKPWKSFTYMAGINGIIQLNPKLSWENKAMIGLSTVKSPDFDLSVNFMGVNETGSISGKPSTYGSLLLGSGLRYNVKNNWCLSAQIDYWLTETELKSTTKNSDGSIEESSGQYMNLSTLSIGLGIGYSF